MREQVRRLRCLETRHASGANDALAGANYVLCAPGHPDHGQVIASIVRKAEGKGFETIFSGGRDGHPA